MESVEGMKMKCEKCNGKLESMSTIIRGRHSIDSFHCPDCDCTDARTVGTDEEGERIFQQLKKIIFGN